MSDQNQDPETQDEVQPNSAADEFFGRMKHDFRRPKPSEEAIASALQAVQKLTGEFPVEHTFSSSSHDTEEKCPKCGAENSAGNRFCGYCGTLMDRPEKQVSQKMEEAGSEGHHVYHHHYHHHIFPDSPRSTKEPVEGIRSSGETSQADIEEPIAAGHRNHSSDAVQKLIQKWSRCFNSKRIDDLMELYSSDSIALRPNSPAAHGRDAVRKVLEGAIESGVGDVQLQCADIGIVGDFACLTGQSKMLVPTAPAKRQEATGKYLIVVRRESSEWKIVADSWCMDSPKAPAGSVGTPAAPSRSQGKST